MQHNVCGIKTEAYEIFIIEIFSMGGVLLCLENWDMAGIRRIVAWYR